MMKTTVILMVGLLAALSVVPTASADPLGDCGGLVDVTCTYGDNQACVLWTDASAPGVPNCLVGG